MSGEAFTSVRAYLKGLEKGYVTCQCMFRELKKEAEIEWEKKGQRRVNISKDHTAIYKSGQSRFDFLCKKLIYLKNR